MLTLLRIGLTAALIYGLYHVRGYADSTSDSTYLSDAFWLAYSVLVAIFAAAAWAPLIGERIADPLTSVITSGTYVEQPNWLLKLIYWLEVRRQRMLVRWLCFIEGVRHPWVPSAFVVGMNNSRPGSWLERIYAKEVWRFDNAQNCVDAYRVLERHGKVPSPHRNREVNILLISLDREVRPESPPVPVPEAPPAPPPQRNPRIQLFEGAEQTKEREETVDEREQEKVD